MARGVAGNAKNAPIKQPTCFGVIAIRLAEMRAITAKPYRKLRIVIQEKRNTPGRSDGHKDFCGALDLIFAGVLQAQLQASDIAGIERCGQGIAKRQRVKSLGGDKVKSAGSVRHIERQSLG
jgi:hypothetical protein